MLLIWFLRGVIALQKRCPNCFNELGARAKKCSSCGEVLSEVKNDGFLPVGTIVNDRYYIGKIYKKETAFVVYSAYDTKNDVKVLIREFSGEAFLNGDFKPTIPKPRLVDRFLNYSRSLASVSLCKLFPRTAELFVWHDNAYTVYSFFEGESLKTLLENGVKISKGNIIKIAKTICDELVILHNSHMIYGALSLDTIYISNSGEVHLFGVGSPFYEFITDVDDRAKVLNPEFCAPETFLNNERRGTYSDVYSLAATVYYLLLKMPLPVGFMRQKGETIKIPHRVNDSIEKSLSTALLNALNWQIKARTKTLNAFYSEVINVKTGRKLSSMILLADVLGVFWYCYDKAKAYALNTIDLLKNKFSKITDKKQSTKTKNSKKLLWVWITIPAILIVGLLLFFLFGVNEKTGILKPNKTTSQTGEETWFYGSGDGTNEDSSKKSFLDIFGVESKKPQKTSSKEDLSSSTDSSLNTQSADSVTSNTQSVYTSSEIGDEATSSQNNAPAFAYSYALKTMPNVSEMDFAFNGKKPLVIEYDAKSKGIFKMLAYDDSNEGANLYINVKDKNQRVIAQKTKISGDNGAKISVGAGTFYVEIFAENPPKSLSTVSLSWAYVEDKASACKLSLGIPSVTKVNNGEAVFSFSLSVASLISVAPAEACAYETDCYFYIKNSSGEKMTDSIMIHGTEWISRKVFLPKGEYTIIVTELNSVAICNVKTEATFDNAGLSGDVVSGLPAVFGFTSLSKGERKVKFNADGIDKLVIKADGVNTYYDSEQTAEIKVIDSNGNTAITETCEGEQSIDISALSGECTVIITADGSCVVEVLEYN